MMKACSQGRLGGRRATRRFWVAASLVAWSGTGAGNVSGMISGERLRLYHSPPPTPRSLPLKKSTNVQLPAKPPLTAGPFARNHRISSIADVPLNTGTKLETPPSAMLDRSSSYKLMLNGHP